MSPGRNNLQRQVVERALGTGRFILDDEKYRMDNHPIPLATKPKSIDEISALLKEAHSQEVSVMPVGGGTRLSLGNVSDAPGIALDTTGLDQPVSINSADLTATFEAGMTLADVQEALSQNDQFLAMDSALSERATIGGILASGASGPLKWHFGHPRDLVIGMKVVQPDGTITKSGGQVVKNVSGYDMARLHIGGLGTLGVIAEVSFKLTPKPPGEKTVIAAFDNPTSCGDAALSIFNSQVMPLALTTFDALKSSASSTPEMTGKQFLAVRLGGRPRALERLTNDTVQTSRKHGASKVETLEGDAAANLWKNLTDYGWASDPLPEVVIRASVVPSRVQVLIDVIVASSTGMNASFAASPGYGNVMILWSSESGVDILNTSRAAIQVARNTAAKLGGSAIIERCPVDLKSEFDVWGETGDSIEIMRRMKQQYDPTGILNPGRFIGGI